jgi:dipeptidyl aminopeptidase/acylaminoacyl peptidase
MEDTHVWVMAADGSGRREVCDLDNRQGDPEWSADGQALYVTVQERGSRVLYRQPVTGGTPKALTARPDSVDSWGFAGKDGLALAISTPQGPSELYLADAAGSGAPRLITHLNADWLASRALARVESFTFPSFDGRTVEAFITIPARPDPSVKHPMIVTIHGGPHGQQGPAFNLKAQVYAAQGWATLMVNYRGSTGYGQKFTDAIFKDQNGGEAKDVLAGVDAALARYPWIDGARLGIEGGSYGGQLTNWIVTRTDRFRAAIPIAGISNLVSFNYMAYYHDYLAVEFGAFPHENGLMDLLWERSPLRYVQNVRTPVMFAHGENDNDVPIAEAEQFYIALRDVGVETVMVRYPREGHGVRETQHVVDLMRRSIEWYRAHFAAHVSSSRQ